MNSNKNIPLYKILLGVSRRWDNRITLKWQWQGGGFEKSVETSQVSAIHQEFKWIIKKMRHKKMRQNPLLAEKLTTLGRKIGGYFFDVRYTIPFLEFIENRHQRFVLVIIPGNVPEIAALPWELFILPGSEVPLLFFPGIRGGVDFVRNYDVGPDINLRRSPPKCLAVWSDSVSRPLLVKLEMDELKDRLNNHPSIRFRWADNPSPGELRGRLNLECSLLLYAGHGKLGRKGYLLELNSDFVHIHSFLPHLKKNRAEILIFDSCDSGLGSSTKGLPALLGELPCVQGLLGMQGPAIDSVSCWYIPYIVEQLFLGRPIWRSVNLLRTLLYDQGSDGWFLPIIHIKNNYKPFDSQGEKMVYLDNLFEILEKRKSHG